MTLAVQEVRYLLIPYGKFLNSSHSSWCCLSWEASPVGPSSSCEIIFLFNMWRVPTNEWPTALKTSRISGMVSTHQQHIILQVLDVRLDLCMSELTVLMFSSRVVSINGGFTEGGRLNAATVVLKWFLPLLLRPIIYPSEHGSFAIPYWTTRISSLATKATFVDRHGFGGPLRTASSTCIYSYSCLSSLQLFCPVFIILLWVLFVLFLLF